MSSPHYMFLWFVNQVWMLTGDKLETATCTAKNAHLITRNQDIHIFRPVSAEQHLCNCLHIDVQHHRVHPSSVQR